MVHHILKIDHPYFEAVKAGDKVFEIRFNDRGYQKGDTVSFRREWEHTPGVFDDPKGLWEITYVTGYKQQDNYVVFGVRDIADKDNPRSG